MRTTIAFLIGCTVGSTAVLLYLKVTSQLAIRPAPAAVVVPSTHPPPLPFPSSPPRVGPMSETLVIPVAGVRAEKLRESFAEARAGHEHGAIDIMAPRGTPVVAAVDGTIRKLFVSGAGGLTIYEADVADERIYYYAHLDAYASGVAEGQRVLHGDVIGYVGTSGNAPPNTPHLHFAISILPPTKEWWKGEAIDPYPLLMQRGVTVEAK